MAKRKLTDEQLLEQLVLYNNNVEFPTQRKFTAKNGLPNYKVYHERFGSFKNAIILSGIKIPEDRLRFFDRVEFSEDELLNRLKIHTEKKILQNGMLLTNNDIDEIEDMPHSSVYCSRFGGLVNAYLKLGIDYVAFNFKAIEKDMIEKYLELYKLLGYPPTSRDLDNYSKNNFGYSMGAYENHFESLNNLRRILGIDIPRNKYGKSCYAKDGTLCLSYVECTIHNFLLNKKTINLKKEVYYKDLVREDKKYLFGTKRCDWSFEHNSNIYVVEYFGLMTRPFYIKSHNQKLNLLKTVDEFIFLPLYAKDLHDLENIFSFLDDYAKDHSEEIIDNMFNF